MKPTIDPLFLVVDLFCGAGGVTTGYLDAELDGSPLVKVIACVNHDKKAIKSHWANHPEVLHFEEDIRTLDLTFLTGHVKAYRKRYPNAKLILWASLECTNFSKAKGGLPRDADSRTLADSLHRHYNARTGRYERRPSYIQLLNPDYIKIENVVEFMSWGPLDKKGKPISRKNGTDYVRWRSEICALGYNEEWKELNSANFGAYTSRNRLFGLFAKPGLPMVWPVPTHAKDPSKNVMFGELKKWMPVKDVLDFSDEGNSIFGRKKPLSDKTLERIYAGLIKYVAKGDTSFISKYYSGKPAGKNISIDGPAGTVTTIDSQALIQTEFLLQTYAANSKGHNTFPTDKPARTITTRDSTQLVQPKFLQHYYSSGGGKISSVEEPCTSVTCMDGKALVSAEFLVNYHGNSKTNSLEDPAPTLLLRDKLALISTDRQSKGQNQSIEEPAGTIMTNDKHRLVTAEPFLMPTNYNNLPRSIDEPAPTLTASRRHHYLVNPGWQGTTGDIEEPCCVIVARQDKVPLLLIEAQEGAAKIAVYDTDSSIAVKIKEFMAAYGLADIKMRMLKVPELLKIQGFPEDYRLMGNQGDQKKFIGNRVVPLVVTMWTVSLALSLLQQFNKKIA